MVVVIFRVGGLLVAYVRGRRAVSSKCRRGSFLTLSDTGSFLLKCRVLWTVHFVERPVFNDVLILMNPRSVPRCLVLIRCVRRAILAYIF